MANKERIEQHNAELQECIALAENLPDAGGGGGGITPSGEIEITENGTYDVTDYASAVVNVAASGSEDLNFDALIEGSVTQIESNAEIVRSSALRDLGGLKAASFPNATTINNYAFNNCRSLESLYLPVAKNITMYVCQHCVSLKGISLPMATGIGLTSFGGCTSMVSAYLPEVNTIGNSSFSDCNNLSDVYAPKALKIENTAFKSCALEKADFPLVASMGNNCFNGCAFLTALVLRKNQVCTLGGTNNFTSTPIASGTGYIYVPAALVDSYKAATNWAAYANQFRSLEDYTVDGTITGELDPEKIGG